MGKLLRWPDCLCFIGPAWLSLAADQSILLYYNLIYLTIHDFLTYLCTKSSVANLAADDIRLAVHGFWVGERPNYLCIIESIWPL